MKTCDGCGVEFNDSVDLFPRLVILKEVQVARRLAEKEDGDMLCLSCWLEATEVLEKKQLAMVLLGLLRKIEGLNDQIARIYKPPINPVVEKQYPTYYKDTTAIWSADVSPRIKSCENTYVIGKLAEEINRSINTSTT